MDFRTYPKVELHLHLDCSVSYDVVHKIDPTISQAAYERDFTAPAKCTDLVEYLKRAEKGTALMQSRENLYLVATDMLRQLQRDNILYAEIRFAPFLHTEQGLSVEEVVEVVNAATAEASAATGVEARLILCTLRHFSPEQSMQTVQLVERFRDTHVVGLDIAGDEAGFPLDAHAPAFQYAVEHAIARTAHAGEASGPASVWETLERLQPARIGHGARSIEDLKLVEILRQERIHLEICPTSNLQTSLCATYADHPIDQLYRLGVPLNVNTDARATTPITLSAEYAKLNQTFGWERTHFLQSNLQAIQASFLPGEEKQRLAQRLQAGYAAL
ncbi:adenosine deaminase [Ktedonosporobacter rubrisoli]|uniref:adenosine deaminase n=1 Tax=Ktedonosporobacter rubrisoli TaxID=2509675 RepID=A0A4P6JN18_KTERU|nr:adenosine deaminase [Ktedonosporobacter rubrisoli]QBD76697.1 adenosine deaminase [Ktedonosporobacter rubrisoli]